MHGYPIARFVWLGGAGLFVASWLDGVPEIVGWVGLVLTAAGGVFTFLPQQDCPHPTRAAVARRAPIRSDESPDNEPVTPSGRGFAPDTVLRPGWRVLVPSHENPGRWLQARIVSTDESGWVRVSYPGWGPEWQEIHHRSCLQHDPTALVGERGDERMRADLRGVLDRREGEARR